MAWSRGFAAQSAGVALVVLAVLQAEYVKTRVLAL